MRIACGVHPRFAFNISDGQVSTLRSLLESEGVVALGEIGLDNTSKNNASVVQQEGVLAKVLPLAVDSGLPVVIHCRGSEYLSSRCLEILKSCLPSTHLVHRHCFSGTLQEAEAWLVDFPNTVFGLTPTCLREGNEHMSEVIKQLPLTKLILESDAPYLIPPHMSTFIKVGSPRLIPEVVRFVSKCRNLPMSLVAKVTARTACQFYSLVEQ